MTKEQQPTKSAGNDNPQPEPASANQKKIVKIILIVVGVIILLSILGTLLLGWLGAHIGTSILNQATDGDVSVNDEGVSYSGNDGETEFSTNQELSEDFPEEVPVYEPSELASSTRMSQEDEVIWSAAFGTESSVSEVYEFYESALATDGWNVDTSFESGDRRSIGAQNEAAELKLQLSITADSGQADGQTGVTLTVVKADE